MLLAYRDQGDGLAFEELTHRYERELYSYLRRYLGSAPMAEDAFQQTFLQVHLKCGQYEAGRSVRPWLYTIATNQAIDSQRRNRRHRMASLDRNMGGPSEVEGGSLVDVQIHPDPAPAELFESEEQRQLVRDALQKLPEPLVQVVMLVYYQGLKYRETADVLAIPVGTVKSRLHAAILKLNELLSGTILRNE